MQLPLRRPGLEGRLRGAPSLASARRRLRSGMQLPLRRPGLEGRLRGAPSLASARRRLRSGLQLALRRAGGFRRWLRDAAPLLHGFSLRSGLHLALRRPGFESRLRRGAPSGASARRLRPGLQLAALRRASLQARLHGARRSLLPPGGKLRARVQLPPRPVGLQRRLSRAPRLRHHAGVGCQPHRALRRASLREATAENYCVDEGSFRSDFSLGGRRTVPPVGHLGARRSSVQLFAPRQQHLRAVTALAAPADFCVDAGRGEELLSSRQSRRPSGQPGCAFAALPVETGRVAASEPPAHFRRSGRDPVAGGGLGARTVDGGAQPLWPRVRARRRGSGGAAHSARRPAARAAQDRLPGGNLYCAGRHRRERVGQGVGRRTLRASAFLAHLDLAARRRRRRAAGGAAARFDDGHGGQATTMLARDEVATVECAGGAARGVSRDGFAALDLQEPLHASESRERRLARRAHCRSSSPARIGELRDSPVHARAFLRRGAAGRRVGGLELRDSQGVLLVRARQVRAQHLSPLRVGVPRGDRSGVARREDLGDGSGAAAGRSGTRAQARGGAPEASQRAQDALRGGADRGRVGLGRVRVAAAARLRALGSQRPLFLRHRRAGELRAPPPSPRRRLLLEVPRATPEPDRRHDLCRWLQVRVAARGTGPARPGVGAEARGGPPRQRGPRQQRGVWRPLLRVELLGHRQEGLDSESIVVTVEGEGVSRLLRLGGSHVGPVEVGVPDVAFCLLLVDVGTDADGGREPRSPRVPRGQGIFLLPLAPRSARVALRRQQAEMRGLPFATRVPGGPVGGRHGVFEGARDLARIGVDERTRRHHRLRAVEGRQEGLGSVLRRRVPGPDAGLGDGDLLGNAWNDFVAAQLALRARRLVVARRKDPTSERHCFLRRGLAARGGAAAWERSAVEARRGGASNIAGYPRRARVAALRAERILARVVGRLGVFA